MLPVYWSHHAPVMYAYSAGVVGFNALLSHELKRHGHQKLARMPFVVDIAVEAPAMRNFTLFRLRVDHRQCHSLFGPW